MFVDLWPLREGNSMATPGPLTIRSSPFCSIVLPVIVAKSAVSRPHVLRACTSPKSCAVGLLHFPGPHSPCNSPRCTGGRLTSLKTQQLVATVHLKDPHSILFRDHGAVGSSAPSHTPGPYGVNWCAVKLSPPSSTFVYLFSPP